MGVRGNQINIIRRTIFFLILIAVALPVNVYATDEISIEQPDTSEFSEQAPSSPVLLIDTPTQEIKPNTTGVNVIGQVVAEVQKPESALKSIEPKQVSQSVTQSQLPAVPELVIASVQTITANKQKYIEIANPHASPLTVKNWTITSSSGSTRKILATLWGTIQPNSSVVIAQNSYIASDKQAIDLRYSDDEPSASGDEVQIVRADGSVVEQICWGSACSGDGLPAFSSTIQAYERKYNQSNQPIMGTMVERFTKVPTFTVNGGGYQAFVNPCADVRLNEIAANVDSSEQFIELYNPTIYPISLEACHLQTKTSSSSKTFTFADQTIKAKEFLVVNVADAGLALTKTTSATVYILSSDMQNEVDAQAYDELNEETAWAYFDGSWKQTYNITENAENTWQEFLPCEEGYERNPETGRCRKIQIDPGLQPCESNQYRSSETNRCRLIASAASVLLPCAPNQYRSPETNRCRLIGFSSSSLKACAANQYRSPETNRCRLLSSKTSSLKSCKKNQERNPDTNRCRKVTKSVLPAADYAIEKISGGPNSPIGWVAFAGVGSLAAGYGVWEWRRELGKILAGIMKAVFRV